MSIIITILLNLYELYSMSNYLPQLWEALHDWIPNDQSNDWSCLAVYSLLYRMQLPLRLRLKLSSRHPSQSCFTHDHWTRSKSAFYTKNYCYTHIHNSSSAWGGRYILHIYCKMYIETRQRETLVQEYLFTQHICDIYNEYLCKLYIGI